MAASSSLLQRGLQVFAVLQWVFSFLGLQLHPSWNYSFGFHPHGVLVVGAFANFCTEPTGFSCLFLELRPHPLMLPCQHCLRGGQVSVLAVGGPLEALLAKLGALSFRIRNQKGFVKSALEPGLGPERGPVGTPGMPGRGGGERRHPRTPGPGVSRALLPRGLPGACLLQGERALPAVPEPAGLVLRRVKEALHPLLSVALPLFLGRRGLQLPFRAPIRTVGEPLPLSRDSCPVPAPSPSSVRASPPRLAFGRRASPELCPRRSPRAEGREGGREGRGRTGDPSLRGAQGALWCPRRQAPGPPPRRAPPPGLACPLGDCGWRSEIKDWPLGAVAHPCDLSTLGGRGPTQQPAQAGD
nr:collagen alpha-1(III) chain-like [Chlorocebus sabaeus]